MTKIGDLRERDDGCLEMLISTGDGEVWSPWATTYVRSALLPGTVGSPVVPPISIADALMAEGWTPPMTKGESP